MPKLGLWSAGLRSLVFLAMTAAVLLIALVS
jgi:hypothetical protein